MQIHQSIDFDAIDMQPVLRRRKRTSERFYISPIASVSSGTQQGTQNTTQNTSGSQKATSTATGTNTGTGAQQNTYLPFQSEIQSGLGANVNNFLTTGVAPNTQNVLNAENAAYNQSFQQGPALQLAAQYGAGSPAIASAEEQGLLQNTANVFSTQAQAYNSELGTAGNLALTPSGSNTQSAANSNENTASNTAWNQALNEAQTLATSAQNVGLNSPTL